MNVPKIRQKDPSGFKKALDEAVNRYFKNKGISKTGNARAQNKAFFFVGMLIVVVYLIYSGGYSSWVNFLLYACAGFFMAGVGMNAMHEGGHQALFKSKTLNVLMSSTIYILAGNRYNWDAQHNKLHHTFTNIHNHDEDLEAGRFIRFSKETQKEKYHYLQRFWLYPVFLYSLLTINWLITTDFTQTTRYLKDKRLSDFYPKSIIVWTSVIVSKLSIVLFWFVLPLSLGINLTDVFVGFIIMHLVTGTILSHIFQLAHVNPDTSVHLEDENFEPTYVHQLMTTANFGTENKFLVWYCGGLTHQVEHHIFPHISHIHYPDISKIVRHYAKKFNKPYNESKDFLGPLVRHYQHIGGLA